ncbi:putative FAD-linked oxidoreductase [Hartmannibacter diazotrophicus]|uniref:Putative FAD-linked oxidoreductase n=1 Tax=Hartmannibacter diazotrophicus TaxID=1482074 RepID=A0A2C9D363_9HYPH|nr:glycolate oxidase subunit GlcE [Hartmannibacter diazotrophicus]SON54598.1 putative FAD-linked oxidoreductase [Hartmannibacter diazotrophicus]
MPSSEDEIVDIVKTAASAGQTIDLCGHGTKRGFGQPFAADRRVELPRMSGIVLYEPEELVVTVKAGTPLIEIERILDENNQLLAFEPADLGPLYGSGPRQSTIGGAIGCNLSGPRRIRQGAARDHVLGVRAVSGRGELFKSGGRVVKNVTGYDLSKVLTGSFGTLAALTEITLKVVPKPRTSCTLVIEGLGDERAVAALSAALGSPADISGAAHLPPAVAVDLKFGNSATLMRIEGISASVDDRADRLADRLSEFGKARRLDAEASADLWQSLRDVAPFAAAPETAIWRVSVSPTAGPGIVSRLPDDIGLRHYYDWGGGLVWLDFPEDALPDGGASVIRSAVAESGGGHATLLRASDELRARVPVFQPQPAPLAALTERLRHQFDPLGILNPGRMTLRA